MVLGVSGSYPEPSCDLPLMEPRVEFDECVDAAAQRSLGAWNSGDEQSEVEERWPTAHEHAGHRFTVAR